MLRLKVRFNNFFELIKQVERVPEKFLKHLEGTEGLFEVRVEYQSNIYKIFCCFDEGGLVVLFNGFQKKTQKIAKNEIEKAERLMKEYFQSKK
jgi:phage-related protein